MFKDVLFIVAIVVFVASIILGIIFLSNMHKVESMLLEYNEYKTAQKLYSASSNIKSAAGELDYDPPSSTTSIDIDGDITVSSTPADYPDPRHARNNISAAMGNIQALYPHITQNLFKLLNSLPDAVELTEYKGRSVDENTFANERQQLIAIAAEVHLYADQYMAQVPDELKSGKSKYTILFVVCIILFIASIFTAFYRWSERSYY